MNFKKPLCNGKCEERTVEETDDNRPSDDTSPEPDSWDEIRDSLADVERLEPGQLQALFAKAEKDVRDAD